MLLIIGSEVRQVLKMRDCVETLERVFAEEARGVAVAVPSLGVTAPRYDSTIVQERVVAGGKRMEFPSPLNRMNK